MHKFSRKVLPGGKESGMEITAQVLTMIGQTNPGDYAVYRVENSVLQPLLCSPGLESLSGMTPDEYQALTEKDASEVVLLSDRPSVAATIKKLMQDTDESAEITLTYRILHKTREFIWIRAKARRIGENSGAPVIMVTFATIASASLEYANLLDNTETSVYVIDKHTYELLYVNKNAQKVSKSSNYRNAQCFRYFDNLDAPCPWCFLSTLKNGAAHIDESYNPALDRWHRYDIRDIDWYGHDAAAFYITNITVEKQRQKQDEERFYNLYHQIASANPDALAIFRLNLTKNICFDVQSPDKTAWKQKSSGKADGYLAACADTITDSKIRGEYMARFTLPNLLREFQNGVTEMSIEYPVRSPEGGTIWVDGFITMMQNTAGGDVEGIACAVDVTGRKISDSIFSRIAEEKCDHIGLINPSVHTYELWQKDSAYGLNSHRRVDYNAVFGDIAEHYICKEDRELFSDHGKLENIVARLNKDGSDTFVYRCLNASGGCMYKQVRYVWLDSRRDLIMETQTDLTPLYEQQIEQVRRQHVTELEKERALSAESIPSGIGVFDFTHGYLSMNYLNNGFYQMIGVPKEAYAKYAEADVILTVYEEDRPKLLQEVETSIQEKRQLRCRFRLPDSTENCHWVEVVANHVPLNEQTERFYVAYYDVDELIRAQMELQEKELVFRDILSYSDIIHFIYYPERHRYEAEILPARLKKFPRIMNGCPDSFIRFIGLNEADAKAYRSMTESIDSGAPEAECTVLMNFESKSGWYRVHLMSVPDGNGHTTKAIGNIFNVDRTVEAEKAIADERLRVELLRGVYLATANFNVTKDTETTFNAGSGISHSVKIDAAALEEARKTEPEIDRQNPETLSTLLSAAAQIPDAGQRREFIRCCSHAGMVRLFREGRRDVTLEYGRKINGKLTWISTRIILMAEPSSGDVLAFYYSRDKSEQKKSEQISKLTIEKNCDFVGLLNVEDGILMIRSISQDEMTCHDGWKPGSEIDYEKDVKSAVREYFSGKSIKKPYEQISVENIMLHLEKAEEYSVLYDRTSPDGTVHRKQIQFRWLDETRSEILVMQTDITVTYIQEQERTRQLMEALAAAEKANNAKTEFISRISHDIRTPISAITNMTAFAKEDADDREKLMHDLSRIESSNTFLLSLINDVLDISKIDSGKIELHPEPYPFNEYIESIRSIFEPLCRQNGQTFRLEGGMTSEGHSVLVDRVRYNQIALNLLSNAVKYTPAGGVITYASHAVKRSDGMIECGFEVADTGIGMSRQFQKIMFEPFTQEFDNPERKKLSSGTGLGLSIVKRLVDLMGGSIAVQSEPGKGTRIRVGFVLPEDLTGKTGAEGQTAGGKENRRLTGKVLLAEDNEINTEIAVRILDSLGLQIDHVENGRQAVEIFSTSAQGEYCAVLMDIQMPVMNGYEAARAIRSLPRTDAKNTPIIAMTADAFEESVREAKSAGMNGYVTKPINPGQLFRELSAAIEKST